ncbi:MAG: molybdopterin-dependent oxidoreductase [Deltaproteobacteria bacterium]|nr:molybdopterin-dependent oxidoreductase [Deltaproteobacteria bacterium]
MLRVSAVHDAGKAVYPLGCVQQIEEGLDMGYGAALNGQLVTDNSGKIRNPSFLDITFDPTQPRNRRRFGWRPTVRCNVRSDTYLRPIHGREIR